MDVTDQQILQCLMIDGRVPMRRIAEVVGVSEQTAARRYRAMKQAGVLRVLVRETLARADQRLWLLRLQCRPDAAAKLGAVLAAREDVAWVALHSGGAELMCTTTLPANAACGTGVLPKLSSTSAVLSFVAYSVMHSYSGGPAEWSGFDRPLTEAQQQRLLNGREAQPRAVTYDSAPSEDQILLRELAADGRATAATLSRALGWPVSRVAAHLRSLIDNGSIDVDVDVLLEHFGHTTSATLLIQVSPSRIGDVGKALSRHPQTSWVAAITGSANITAAVTCRNSHELFQYVTGDVGPLTGVIHVEILPVLNRLKQAATRVINGRLE